MTSHDVPRRPQPAATDPAPCVDSGAQSYEGRLLPRPHEELVDQGLLFDLGTLTRRRLLGSLGLGVGALALAACGGSADPSAGTSSADAGSAGSAGTAGSGGTTGSTGTGEIPDETAGPYPGDGSNGPDILEQSGVVRRDLRTSFGTGSATAAGVPLTTTLTITNLADGGTPFAGAAVYLWHCDREGRYSMYSAGVENENYLRGVQIADAQGTVTFTSIFPACYTGRWPHLHFEVYPDEASITDAANAIATSQVALPPEACAAVFATAGYEASVTNLTQVSLSSDNIFGDDGGAAQLPSITGDPAAGYAIALTAGVDTRTTPSAGGAPGSGGPGGPPPSAPPTA